MSTDILETQVETTFSNVDRARSEKIERELFKAALAVGAKNTRDGYDQSSRHLGFSMDASMLNKFCELAKAHCAKVHANAPVHIKISGSITI